MRKKIYISGPIAHHDLQERKSVFHFAENKLMHLGYEPINPFNNGLPDEADWRKHMKADMTLLAECDAIYLLKGWYTSKGSKLELDVASSCGMEVVFE